MRNETDDLLLSHEGAPAYPDDDGRSMCVIGMGIVAVVCSAIWFVIGYVAGAY